jgi:ISXO2-like transposase domain
MSSLRTTKRTAGTGAWPATRPASASAWSWCARGTGRTLPAAFPSETAALSFIRHRVEKGTALFADDSSAWNELHARYEVKRINHQLAYSMQDGTHTNGAEGFFSRMRRAEIGHHHHFAGTYLARYAQESAWREDHRRQCNGSQMRRIVALALAARPSVDFCGYWQRANS